MQCQNYPWNLSSVSTFGFLKQGLHIFVQTEQFTTVHVSNLVEPQNHHPTFLYLSHNPLFRFQAFAY